MRNLKPFTKRHVGIIYGKKRARKTWFGGDLNFMGVRFFLPRSLYNSLTAFRAVKGVPIARLVAIAVFNEMTRIDAFKLTMLASTVYEPGKYSREAAEIFKFLTDNKGGMAKDLLVMSRAHIGITDENAFLHGITELVETGLVEEILSISGSDTPWVQIKNFSEGQVYDIKRRLGK